MIAEFWSKVDTTGGPDACWPWKGWIDRDGYGLFAFAGTYFRAHRIACFLFDIEAFNRHLLVCHSCDNPGCCNPKHLWQGTIADNNQDKKDKGRSGTDGDKNWSQRCPECRRGVNNGNAKLTERDVKSIRKRYASGGISMAALAEEYNLSPFPIRAIVTGQTWRHLK